MTTFAACTTFLPLHILLFALHLLSHASLVSIPCCRSTLVLASCICTAAVQVALDVLIAHGVNSLKYSVFKDLDSAAADAFAMASMAASLAKKRKNKKKG